MLPLACSRVALGGSRPVRRFLWNMIAEGIGRSCLTSRVERPAGLLDLLLKLIARASRRIRQRGSLPVRPGLSGTRRMSFS